MLYKVTFSRQRYIYSVCAECRRDDVV